MCPMCSTPPPTTTSWTPLAICAAAKLTACCADPHWRSIVVAGVSIGSPACSQALRPMLYDCSPYCCTQPVITSSTASGGIAARSITSTRVRPRRSFGCTSLHPAPRKPLRGDQAAVDVQRLADDVPRVVACEKGNGARDLVASPEAPERCPEPLRCAQHVLADSGSGRFQEAGRDDVDADALHGELLRDGPCEADHARLGGGVMRVASTTIDAADGRDVDDDPPAAGFHGARGRARTEERPVEMHCEHHPPLLVGEANERVEWSRDGTRLGSLRKLALGGVADPRYL